MWEFKPQHGQERGFQGNRVKENTGMWVLDNECHGKKLDFILERKTSVSFQQGQMSGHINVM